MGVSQTEVKYASLFAIQSTLGSHEASFQKAGGQPGRMGVEATPKSKDDAYWTPRENKEFEGFDQKCFDHHPFYVGYTLTTIFIVS